MALTALGNSFLWRICGERAEGKRKSCLNGKHFFYFREKHFNLFHLTFLRVQLWPGNVEWEKNVGRRRWKDARKNAFWCGSLSLSPSEMLFSSLLCLMPRISSSRGEHNKKTENNRGKGCFHNVGIGWHMILLSRLVCVFHSSFLLLRRFSLFALSQIFYFSLFLCSLWFRFEDCNVRRMGNVRNAQ